MAEVVAHSSVPSNVDPPTSSVTDPEPSNVDPPTSSVTDPEPEPQSPSPGKAEDGADAEESMGEIITDSMKAEEAKLHEETVKEEEDRRKETEQELHRMDESMREQRYKRLQFLLTKSNMYTHYLLRRMHKQRELEDKQRRLREQRRARNDKAKHGEDAPADNENTETEEADTKDIENGVGETKIMETALSSLDTTAPETALSPLDTTTPEQQQQQRRGRKSPRAPAAVPTARSTRVTSGKQQQQQQQQQQQPVSGNKGQKRKACTENYNISDMFAEALDRNKRRKKDVEDDGNSQEEKENATETTDDAKKEDEGNIEKEEKETAEDDNENAEVKESSPKNETQKEANHAGGRCINGEAVPDAQPVLFTGGVLREYQIEGFRWLKVLFENGVNGILADEMGLGKTIQCIAVIASLVYQGLVGPFLVVGPLSTVPNWVAEFKKFAPKVPVILYHGSGDVRAGRRKGIMKLHTIRAGVEVHPVVVTSYEIAMNDRRFIGNLPWKYIIVDEGHRIKNFQCKLIKELKQYHSTHRLLLTGTPLQNNLQELWSLLNFLLPEIFDDLGSFESWFDISFLETDSSNEAIVVEEQRNSILTMLHQILSPFMLRRVKTDVALNIPPKREVLVYAPLSPAQTDQYRTIVDRTIRHLVEGDEEKERAAFEVDAHGRSKRRRRSRYSKETLAAVMATDADAKVDEDDDIEKWFKSANAGDDPNNNNNNGGKCPQIEPKSHELKVQLRNTMFMLRKCCNHPYLIEYPLTASGDYRIDADLVTASGKLMLLDRMLGSLKADGGHKVLIFSQMTQIMNILEDYCHHRSYKYCRLDGSMKIEDRTDQIADFNKDPDIFIFLLSTRAGGLGINLTAADTCIIFDSDWNPQCDLQAQDRCHRIGQTKPVMVFRLITANTIDQKIVERAAAKRKLEKMVITQGKFKSGGCWSAEDGGVVPAEEEDLARHGTKIMSAMSPQELLQLLKSADFDSKHEAARCGEQVISDADLARLLDRTDLWRKMAAGRKEEKSTPAVTSKSKKGKKQHTPPKYEDVDGVFKVMDEDMGGSTLDVAKQS